MVDDDDDDDDDDGDALSFAEGQRCRMNAFFSSPISISYVICTLHDNMIHN